MNEVLIDIPYLRFTEFNTDWKKSLIGEYYKYLRTGMTPSRTKPHYFKGENLWITSGELNYGYIDNTHEKITNKAISDTNLKLYPANTFFIAITGLEAPGTRGKCAFNRTSATTNQSCLAFEEVEEVNSKFLFYWYQKYGERLYYKYAQGTKQQSYNNKIVENFVFIHPKLQEQKKIASFLTAVDKKLNQLQCKKDLLAQYKKGVMQQVFNQELRFKNDSENAYPDWEEKKLGEIASKSSSNISANTIEENSGDYKIYGASGLLKFIDFYRENERYISIVKDGAGVGRTLLCDAFSSVLGTLDIIKAKENNNLYFIYALINNIHFPKYITGSTIPHIYFKDYSKEKIRVPCKEEQTKIADFLCAIDKKIELVNTQLENTQQFKKGLLQQMFV